MQAPKQVIATDALPLTGLGKPDKKALRAQYWDGGSAASAEAVVDASSGACFGGPVTRTVEADYLVVGAGATGMAFTDALIDHADVRVALVDRRHGVGGHWLDAYPFVRLHQASTFYGVASTVLGGGRVQQRRARGRAARAGRPAEICAYYDDVLTDRMLGLGPGRVLRRLRLRRRSHASSRASRVERFEVPERLPDRRRPLPRARHPGARRRRRSASRDGARVIPVNDLVRRRGGAEPVRDRRARARPRPTPASGCWRRGVDPDAICWVRPRDPWMLNRAVIQPDPAVYLGHGRRHDAGRGRRRPRCDDAVPAAGGRRHHAAHRPHGDADDGQGAHPRARGSSTCCARIEHVVRLGHIRHGRAAAGSTSTRGRSRSPTTRSSCTARPTA